MLQVVALLGLFSRAVLADDCNSFGVDFTDGGNFFQNALSTDPFAFVQEFSGACQQDTSQNLLVDPTGNQYQCGDTPLLPMNTPENSTCPITKNKLTTGAWSLLVLSNNGDGNPFAWQRDFSLTVGTQVTTLVTPTVSVPITITPQVNATTTVTDTSVITIPAVTTTVPALTKTPPIKTLTPPRITSTVVKVLRTITMTKPTLVITKVTHTAAPSCYFPPRRQFTDRQATIKPTLAKAATLASLVSSAAPTPAKVTQRPPLFGRKIAVRDLEDVDSFLVKRDAYLAGVSAHAIVKRAPDLPTITATETDTAKFITSYATVTAPPVTNMITGTAVVSSTLTPQPITVVSGVTILPRQTITAATPTRILTRYTVAWDIVTRTIPYTVTITATPTSGPAFWWINCWAWGGFPY